MFCSGEIVLKTSYGASSALCLCRLVGMKHFTKNDNIQSEERIKTKYEETHASGDFFNTADRISLNKTTKEHHHDIACCKYVNKVS